VGLIQTLENLALDKLSKLVEPIFRPLKRLFSAVKSFFSALIDLVPETIALVRSIISEVNAFRHFREQVNFKTGVVSLKSVQDHIADLIQEIIDAWHALISIWQGAKLNPIEQINEASAALAELVEELGHIGQFTEFLKGIGAKLEKVGGKVFEVLAIIQQIAEISLDVVRKLQTVVNAVRDVRETFETGEGLFLPQTNKRKTLTLADGSKIKIRLGALHQ